MTHRIDDIYRPAEQRRRDFREVERPLSCAELHEQAARCMGCGIPFCHGEVSARERDSGIQRGGVFRRLARGVGDPLLDQQFP